jgi:hypothetical protein
LQALSRKIPNRHAEGGPEKRIRHKKAIKSVWEKPKKESNAQAHPAITAPILKSSANTKR